MTDTGTDSSSDGDSGYGADPSVDEYNYGQYLPDGLPDTSPLEGYYDQYMMDSTPPDPSQYYDESWTYYAGPDETWTSDYDQFTDLYDEYSQQADDQQSQGQPPIDVPEENPDTGPTTGNLTDNEGTGDEDELALPPADPRFNWNAFVLPSGFTFDEIPLPAETYFDDLFQLTPDGTDSFVSETLYCSMPVVVPVAEEFGIGEHTVHWSTLVTLSQSWTSPTEWSLTQTRLQTFTSVEQSTDGDGLTKDFHRVLSILFNITVTSGQQVLVTRSLTDSFTVGVGKEWNNVPDATSNTPDNLIVVGAFVRGENEIDELPVDNVDQGFFRFSSSRTASVNTTWGKSRITTPSGPATRYTVGLSLGGSIDQSAGGLSLFSQTTGTLVPHLPVQVSGDGPPLINISAAPNGDPSQSPPGNGSSTLFATGLSVTSRSGVTFHATRHYDVPDDETLPTIISGNASYAETASGAASNRLGLRFQVQDSTGDEFEYLTYSITLSGSDRHSFDFHAAADFGEAEISSDDPSPPLTLAAMSSAGTTGSSASGVPEMGLEMSLEEDSRRTEELHYTRRENIASFAVYGEIAVRIIDYHVIPISHSTTDVDLTTNDDGDVILVLSSTTAAGFRMYGSIIEQTSFNYAPGLVFTHNELYRDQTTTRLLEETRTETETSSISLNLSDVIDWDAIEITTTTGINASGSDITTDHTTWHVWDQAGVDYNDENGTGGQTPVFIEDIPIQIDTSLTYDYTRDAEGDASGMSMLVHTESGGRYVNASGTLSVGMLSVTTTTNLVTGEQTTETTSTFPAYVPLPATESFLEPGSYWYYLLNPSAMDDDLEGCFHGSLTVAGGSLLLAGGVAAAPWLQSALASQSFTLTYPTYGLLRDAATGVVVLVQTGTATATFTGTQVVNAIAAIGLAGTSALHMSGNPLGRELDDAWDDFDQARINQEGLERLAEMAVDDGDYARLLEYQEQLSKADAALEFAYGIYRNLLYCVFGIAP